MLGFRSVLWIGGGDGFDAGIVADAPSADFTWARHLDDALALPLAAFDGLVLDAADAAEAASALRRLRAAGAASTPIVVRLPGAAATTRQSLRAVGAADVLPLRSSAEGGADALLRALADAVAERERGAARGSARARGRSSADGESPHGIVGRSPAMRAVFALVERAMRSQATVLISGETGTGKELLARAIHAGSTRNGRPFVAVNCAAFTDTLLESELFGHVKGAFTGADRDKKGLFEEASGGTLFLDEIGETTPALQAKLLRVLQEREVRPVGGTRARPVDVRLLAATNRSLRHEVSRGAFREDLYYRLAVFPIAVPPLRERPEDVLPLAEHFLATHARREGKPGCTLSAEARQLLQSHVWPGNVRELENEMQRALALCEAGEEIDRRALSERVAAVVEPVEAVAQGDEPLRATLGRIEALLIRRTLDALGGRRAATARRLGITREGLYKKMRRHGIE